MRHIELGVGRWAWSIARQARSGMEPERHDELEQECYLKLWEELKDDTPTFLFENFEHTLDLICKHVAHSVMEKAGEWKRRGVQRPKRIPSGEITSLHTEPVGADDPPLVLQLVSTSAQDELDQTEYADLLQEVENLPLDERKIIYGLFFRDLTQEELARELNVTDRTIRNRLQRILHKLLQRYQGDQEDNNV